MSSKELDLDPTDEKHASDLTYSPQSTVNLNVPNADVLEAGDAPLGPVTGASSLLPHLEDALMLVREKPS